MVISFLSEKILVFSFRFHCPPDYFSFILSFTEIHNQFSSYQLSI